MIGFPSNAWTGEGWPDLLVWIEPNLFGLEVKQGKAHATERQLSRLVSLRKHHVHAWIVRTPQEATSIIQLTLEGLLMTFNDDLLADLDAALMGGVPAPTPDPTPTVEELPWDNIPEAKPIEPAEDLLDLAVPEPLNGVVASMAAESDALERVADALEALVIELRMLNTNVRHANDEVSPGPNIEQTAAAPTVRRRRKSTPEAQEAPAS